MRFILNVIWLVLCGIWMAIAWALAGLVCFLLFFLVITIPFGIAAFRIANYVLWPFGRTVAPREGGWASAPSSATSSGSSCSAGSWRSVT
jgi:uncharacterized membrane protein YccF (DUF307 family)